MGWLAEVVSALRHGFSPILSSVRTCLTILRLGAAAVEVDAGDVVHDDLGGLNGELGVGGADLVDEVGLLDGGALVNGARFAVVGDDASVG